MAHATIYMLIDPRDEEIRYIGWTSRTLERRLYEHVHIVSHGRLKKEWVRQLLQCGLEPRIQVIQQVPAQSWAAAKIYWIGFFRKMGCPLTNMSNGGDGNLGCLVSEETRAKMRAAWTENRKKSVPRRPHTEASKEKLRQATLKQFENPAARAAVSKVHKGKVISPEQRATISAVTKRRWKEWRVNGCVTSPETRAKMSAAKKGKPLSEEHKAKIRASTKGIPKSEEWKAKARASWARRKAIAAPNLDSIAKLPLEDPQV